MSLRKIVVQHWGSSMGAFSLPGCSPAFWSPQPASAADLTNEGEDIVQSTCVGCHRIQGVPMPRSTKNAPDLIWAGNKYQRDWLVTWLQNPKEKLYPVGYDFKFKRKGRHLAVLPGEAEKVAAFLSTLKDARITQGLMKPGTPEELARGEQL